MKKICFLALMVFVSVLCAAASANDFDVAADGQWHNGQTGGEANSARFMFKLDKPEYIVATLTAPEGMYGSVYPVDSSYAAGSFPYQFNDVTSALSTQSIGCYLNPGRYFVSAGNRRISKSGTAAVKLNVIPTDDFDEAEPNEFYYQASPFDVASTVTAAVANGGDEDWFVARIDEAGLYRLDIKGNLDEEIRITVYDQHMKAVASERFALGEAHGEPVVRSIALSLEEGGCYVQLAKKYTYEGLYDYSFTLSPVVECQSISLPKSLTLTSGILTKMDVSFSPEGSARPKLIWKSSNYSIATVTDDGYAKGWQKGTATFTAQTSDGKLKAKCKVKVVDNVFSRPKPLVGKEKELYASVKKLNYEKDGTMTAQVYLVNRTGQALKNSGDFYVEVYFKDKNQTLCPLYRKNFDVTEKFPALGRGAKRVITLTVPRRIIAPYYMDLDLPGGECEVVAGGWLYSAKNVRRFKVVNLGGEAKS